MPNDKDRTATAVALTQYEFARSERQVAESRHAEALAAVEGAKAALANLRERNSRGDASVTGLDLLTAEAEVPRLEGLASASAVEVDEAKAAEAPALAEYTAHRIGDRVGHAQQVQEEAAVTAIGAALSRLVDQMAERNALIRECVTEAQAAGVEPGNRNDERITFGVEPYHPRLQTIQVAGVAYKEAEPQRVLLDVVTKGLRAVGYRLTGPGWTELAEVE